MAIDRSTLHRCKPRPWMWAMLFIVAPGRLHAELARWLLISRVAFILGDKARYSLGGRKEAYAVFLAGADIAEQRARQRQLRRWRVHQARMLRDFWQSFALSALLVAAALAVGAFHGSVRPGLPLDQGKALQLVGGALAAWGTFFALGHAMVTNDGKTPLEQLRPRLFLLLAGPGALLAAAGTVW